MKINKIHESIYEIENFINEKDTSILLDILNNYNEKDWFTENDQYTTDFWQGKNLFFYHDILKKINKDINNLFSSSDQIASVGSISRHRINESMGEHTDHWILDSEQYVAYGIVIYYNDDYEGGEINYPKLGIKIKPKARSLIMHAGNILHGTLPVLNNNVRYFSTSFIKGTKENPVVLNKEIFGDQHAI